MPHGYHGRIIHVDLTSGTFEIEQPDESFYRLYMGGSALGAYYLLRDTPVGADPLGPENTLVLALSVVTGAPLAGLSRLTAVAKSPLTDVVGDSQCGGFFPAKMKFAGFDAAVIHGRAPKPVYLWIHDGEVELRSAEHLWGRVTGDVDAAIREELRDRRIEVLQCGPAGERLARFAAIMNRSSRACGRTGLGAVMGSKNLKGLAVRGSAVPTLADPRGVRELASWGAKHFEASDIYGLRLFGTAEGMNAQNSAGGLPAHNWDSGYFANADALSGPTISQTILVKTDTCHACMVRCKRVVQVPEGPYRVEPLYGGPEYESLSALGTYCDIDDLRAVTYANQLCNMYGLDTISCGATIAWAMDCYEHGIITRDDTGGLELRFGDPQVMVRLTEMIAKREGFGDLLAEGSARAAAEIGRGAEDLVVAVKGEELPAHMPQVKRSLALIYAVNPFGADHESSEHDPSYVAYPHRMAAIGLTTPQPDEVLNPEKVEFTFRTQHVFSCLDTLNVCHFVWGISAQLYDFPQLVQAVRAITGWPVDLAELLKVGERRVNLLRAFNAHEGVGRQQDTLPRKLMKPLSGGKSDGLFVSEEELERAKDVYYQLAGWDVVSGMPSTAKLEELGLGWVQERVVPQARREL
jgi:aldehyde:ferredoxin oxidoreductase